MMTIFLRRWLVLLLVVVAGVSAWAQGANTSQQLVFAGLRAAGMQGQFNGVQVDGAGNVFLLLNAGDGVRVLKTDGAGAAVAAQALLGAKGDIGLGLALDPAGNVYVTGTTTSTALVATAGAAVATRTDSSTNSFVAKFDGNLNPLFVSFTGGSRISAVAVAATADAVFVTGTTYAANLPVTANGIQQAPAPGSAGNGFVERFSASGATLVYATYLTGASGDTNPAAVAVDAADDAYVVGETSASGYPTVAALVPRLLGNPSGFVTKLTPGGDAISFSTFVPGAGLTSVALDSSASSLLVAGSVALGQFAVDAVAGPVAAGVNYQVLVRMKLDGSGVVSSTLLAPGTGSYVAAGTGGGAWVVGALGTPLLPLAALSDVGSVFAEHLQPAGGGAFQIDQTVRLGGVADGNVTYASLPAVATSVTVDAAGEPFFAGAVQPTASASLLASEGYDLPLRNAPTTALPSSIANAEQTAATCSGSLCAGSAGYLAKVNPNAAGVSLSVSVAVPFVVVRNLGSAAATGLQLAATGSAVNSNCPTTLAAGAECDALLSGGAAGTLTVSGGGDTQGVAFGAYAAPSSTIVFYPKELDFGIVTPGAPVQRVITVSNLGTTSQTFASSYLTAAGGAAPFTEAASDCTLAGSATNKVLAAGGTCHITIALASASDAALAGDWAIGKGDVALTGYSQSTALSVSSSEVDFGTHFVGGLRLPRYVYLSNSSGASIAHAAASLPASSPFQLSDGCPATLIAGSVCRIRVDYVNTQPASDSATLTLDAGLSVLLTGTTLPPAGVTGTTANPNLAVTPTTLAFSAAVPVTTVSAETQTASITNTGTSPFALSLAVTGDFTEVTSCGAMLAGGATCAVTLSFVPSQPGQRTGLLAVTAGAGTSPVYVTLLAIGTAILPANNGTLALGSTPVGQPVVQYFKISQPFSSLTVVTAGPFAVDLIEDTGYGVVAAPASAFSANFTGSCRNCYLAVEFLPTAAGVQTGSLLLSSATAGTPYGVAVTGTGTALSGLVLTPGAQDFGSVPVHSSSGAVLFTLVNLTASPATLTAPAVTGDFAILTAATGSQPCSGTLAVGATCAVQVAFSPTETGTRAGTLTVSGSTAALTGVGSADPGLAIRPLALVFKNVPGAAATMQTVTLTNTGSGALTVGAVSAGTAQFSPVSACATLAPGASCAVAVTYQPGTAVVSDTLSIAVSGGTAATFAVGLTGSYTASSAGLEVVPGVSNFGPGTTGVESAARQITVNNDTAKTLALNVVIPRQYVLASAPCTTLAPGATCGFSVAFLPLTNGNVPGSVVVQATPSDGSSALSSIGYVEGYGVGTGALTLTGGLIVSGTYNFGQVAAGQTAQQLFTVTNTSASSSLTVRRVTSAPPFAATTTCGATLVPGGMCTVTVMYTPVSETTTTGAPSVNDAGTLVIESDAAAAPTVLNLVGQNGGASGSGAAAIVATYTLSQGSLTFGSTTVGNSSAGQTITLLNTGTVGLTVQALGATPDFGVSSTCGTVAPGAACSVTVVSTPQTAGMHVASLEIASTATTALEFVSLVSTSNASPLVLTPSSLNFGSAVVGTATQLPVQVTNSGTAPITFTSITASGDYGVSGSCPAGGGALAGGASCTVLVTFTPTMTGSRPGTLSVASSASTLPRTVALVGAGIQSKLVIAPSALAFGPLVVGASANLTVTLRNGGTAAVTGLVLSVSGDYSVSLPCPTTLAAGATCTAQITFTPTAGGARAGTLRVASSDPASPVNVPLTGTGILPGSFVLTVDGGAASNVTVQSGKPATYHLTVTPTGSFSGAVALTCAAVNAGQFASCSLSPSSLTLAGVAQTAVATVNTITSVGGNAKLSRPAVHPGAGRAETMVCLLLPGLYTLWRRRRSLRRKLPALALVMVVGVAMLVSGCGGKNDFDARYTPAGTYQYQVTAVSTSGIQITQTVMLNLVVTPR